jgi:hypothetical protein
VAIFINCKSAIRNPKSSCPRPRVYPPLARRSLPAIRVAGVVGLPAICVAGSSGGVAAPATHPAIRICQSSIDNRKCPRHCEERSDEAISYLAPTPRGGGHFSSHPARWGLFFSFPSRVGGGYFSFRPCMVKVTFLFDPSKASEGHSRASICHSRASICHSRENGNPDTYPPLTRRSSGGVVATPALPALRSPTV